MSVVIPRDDEWKLCQSSGGPQTLEPLTKLFPEVWVESNPPDLWKMTLW